MPKQILLVEDDRDLTEAMVDILHRSGYQTDVCTNYRSLIPYLEQHQPDLIVMDGYLQQYDGRDLFRQIKSDERYRHIPVIFASVMTNEQLAGIEPEAILIKAFGMHELNAAVSKILG